VAWRWYECTNKGKETRLIGDGKGTMWVGDGKGTMWVGDGKGTSGWVRRGNLSNGRKPGGWEMYI
jgi:hypothetical protein